jgi:uncharacterized protein
MRIPIRQLPQGHSRRELEEEPEGFDLTEWLTPAGPVRAELDLERRGEQITVRGQVAVEGEVACSRCTRPTRLRVEAELLLYSDTRGSDSPQDEAALEEEGAIHYHDGLELVLDDVVREAIILEVPPAPLCRADCRGLCSGCGEDLNEGSCSCGTTGGEVRWKALESLKEKPK